VIWIKLYGYLFQFYRYRLCEEHGNVIIGVSVFKSVYVHIYVRMSRYEPQHLHDDRSIGGTVQKCRDHPSRSSRNLENEVKRKVRTHSNYTFSAPSQPTGQT
jgi:hypothetical protein